MDSASVLSLAPRKVRKPAGKVIPKPSQAIPELPVASTSALSEPNPVAAIPESNDAPVTSSATPIAFEEEPEIDKATLKRQADLLFQVEACLSDWGLSRAQELLERISAAEDGWIHISNILQLPSITSFKTTLGEIMQLRSLPSDLVQFDESGFKVKRLLPLDAEAVSSTDWSNRAYYFENIPLYPSNTITPSIARTYLSELLSTRIQTVHFPQLHNSDSSNQVSNETLLAPIDKAAKEKEKASRLPVGGGSFKGFCFAVLGDQNAVDLVKREWSWNREAMTLDEESDDDDAVVEKNISPQEKAKRAGLRSMPLSEWNKLKSAYLSYQRALTNLQPTESTPYDRDRRSSYTERESRSHTSRREPDWRRRRSPSPQRATTDWKSAREETWNRETKYTEQAESTFPKGVVCFVKNVHPKTNKSTLKSLFNDAIDQVGAMKVDEVVYVDFEAGLDSAHVRMSTPGAAVALKMYFQGRGAIMAAKDCSACAQLGAEGQEGLEADATPLSIEIFDGEKEKLYWSKIPLHARSGNRAPGKSRGKRGRDEFTSVLDDAVEESSAEAVEMQEELPEAKHTRFE